MTKRSLMAALVVTSMLRGLLSGSVAAQDLSALVERAFRQTFQSIKPTDAVIVGMYNEFNDEPTENAELVRR